MDDEADVGLVDPHAEGDGRHHHRPVLGEEALQPPVAFAGVHAGVVGDGVGPGLLQRLGHPLAAIAAAAVDHPGLAAPFAHQGDHSRVCLRARAALLAHRRELEVRPREAVDQHLRPLQPQRANDVLARAGVGGGGDGDARHAGEDLGEAAEGAIVGAEIVAPLADAVGLVDRDEAERQLGQTVHHGAGRQALGRDVEQVQFPGSRRAPDGRAVVEGDAGVEPRRAHALLLQRLDLVGHQGDQRRDHQAKAGAQDGGNLVAHRLAAAGGQHRQHVAAGEDLRHDRGLQAPEVGVAPDPLQRRPRLGQGRRGRGEGRVGEHAGLVPHLFPGVSRWPVVPLRGGH